MKKVLFSFVGKSDPIMNNWDGPFLHIIRHNQINKVYLYFTKEMVERDVSNIYEETIKALDSNVEVIKIYRENIVNPHKYGLIDDDLKDIFIKMIKPDNPNATIYVNLTSGTPQMCSSLYLVAMNLPFQVELIQVEDPEPNKIKNKNALDYMYMGKSGNEILEDSLDNIESKNRCVVVENKNFTKFTINENVSSLLDSYNYYNAYKLVEKYKDLYTNDIIDLIYKVYLKYNSNHSKARLIKTKEELYPILEEQLLNIMDINY